LAREDAIIAMNTITELSNDLYEQQQRAEAAEEQVQQLEVAATELKQQVTRQLAVVKVTQDSTSALRGVVSEAIAELRVISDTADDADTTKSLLTILQGTLQVRNSIYSDH
jgi:predicted  nucleic acid-binding Zn-ribbon protein